MASSLATKQDYELMSNGSSVSLSLNDSYSCECELASGSSALSSFGEGTDDNSQTSFITSNTNTNSPLSPLDMQVVSLVNEAWEYRGEGGANLVLSVLSRHKIIRFTKR